ncbi:MAG: AI-2E family transporter [Oscillospiraceae bacterium]|nr:AI-2E family transporter [Oscillospiraceae bacterium]
MGEFNFRHKWLFIICGAVILAAVINPDLFGGFFVSAVSVLRPVIIGMAAAFIINRPICKIFDIFLKASDNAAKRSYHKPLLPMRSITKTGAVFWGERRKKLWIAAVITGYGLIFAFSVGIIWFIIPQLLNSLSLLADNADLYRTKFTEYYRAAESKDFLGLLPVITSAVKKIREAFPDVIAKAYGRTADLISGFADFIIGIIISVYILVGKERLRVIVQKTAKHIMNDDAFQHCASLYHTVYDVFTRFISGQVTEALILGVLCYIGMKLFRFEYALLISTIIGITALIPVVGAIVGTIPCAFLLFLVKPISAIWFILYIIVLQQLENNLIYPKVVGKSVGLPPLPVLLAILIGARIGGCAGILLAVPLTAVVYGVFTEKIMAAE